MTATTDRAAEPQDRITWTDMRESAKGVIAPRRWAAALRHPNANLKQMVGSGPVFPLLILFGLNCGVELVRTGFGILLPNSRDAFGLTNTGILTLVGLTALGALILQLPIAIWADRGNRVLITLLGAATWAVFSILTGAATATWMLIIARSGSGIGRAVVDPTHNSLLSDYYPVDRRPAVFSFHRAANVLGQVQPDDLVTYGMIPEFVGRLPCVTALESLDEEALVRIQTEPRNALIKQYQKFFHMENAKLEFTTPALRAISRKAMKRDVGARALRAIVEELMLHMMFDLPEQQRPGTIYEITEAMVEGERPTLLETVKVTKEKESA